LKTAVTAGILFLAPVVVFGAIVDVAVGPGLSFTPSTVTINTGDTVRWTWSGALHTSTSNTTTGAEVWDSGLKSTGTFSHTFTHTGDWPYYCSLHSFPGGTAMNGVVHVAAPAPPPAITEVQPAAAAPTTQVIITGSNFQNGATVLFGTSSASVTFVNAGTLFATVPNVAAGPVTITVTNPDAQSGTFNGFIALAISAIPLFESRALLMLMLALAIVGVIALRIRG
jgi:plastocyanin